MLSMCQGLGVAGVPLIENDPRGPNIPEAGEQH